MANQEGTNVRELDLITIPEVAALLRVPEGTVRYWRFKNYGPPAFKVGKGVRYERSEVMDWLKAQKLNA